jgi:hypothetical protein
MNFNLSEEQTMIQDSIARFVQDNYELDQRNAVVAQEHGFSADHWQQFAELGWLSIPFAEEYGGFGGGPVDTMVIMQELGRGLVAEPFLPTVLLFGGLLQVGATEELKQQLIPQIIAGELHGAFAWVERHSRYEITDIRTRARQDGVDWVLNGEKTVVLNGGVGDLEAAARHLIRVDGVMIGRQAYQQPLFMNDLAVAHLDEAPVTALTVMQGYIDYMRGELDRGIRLHDMTRHCLGLFAGMPGARNFRRLLSDHKRLAANDLGLVDEALDQVLARAA